MTWFIYTVLSGLFIGSSFFFRRMAAKTTGSLNGFIVEGIVYGVLMLFFLFFQRNKGAIFNNPWYPVFSAVALFFGAMFLYKALAIGKLSVTNVVYLALSLCTVLIVSFFALREQLAIKQIFGLLLGVAAIFLLS